MLRTSLYEESAGCADSKAQERRYKIFHIASLVCLIIAGVLLFVSLLLVPSMAMIENTFTKVVTIVIWFIPIVILLGCGFLFFKIKRRFNVSFDYTFVEDELRVTKVFNGKTRKYIATFKADQILKVGYVESSSFERMTAGLKGRKPVYLTPNRTPTEGKIMIYLHAASSIDNKMYILECRKELLEHIVFAAGRNKFDPQ